MLATSLYYNQTECELCGSIFHHLKMILWLVNF
jgi:hypothetical protein